MTTDTLTRIENDVNATLDILSDLRARKSDIALLRRQGLHLTAAIQRDEMLARLEAWLDPDGAIIKLEQMTAQRAYAAASALAIDEACGF